MTNATTIRSRRSLPQIERLRRGWVFRDAGGRGWWLDDTVVANRTHRVVPTGHPSGHCRVFTPMIGARDTARRVYRFRMDEDHRLAVSAVAMQHARAVDDPT